MARPGVADHTNNDRCVVKDVGGEDRPKGVEKLDRGRIEVEQRHQSQVHPTPRPQQGVEPGGDHNRGQDERQGGKQLESFLSGKGEMGKQPGAGQADHQGQQGGKGCLEDGEP